MATPVIPEEVTDGHAQAVISVEATDAAGATASLSIPFDVYRQYVVRRDSSMDRIVEREPIVMACDPIPPSTQRTEVRYRENNSDIRALAMGMNIADGLGDGGKPEPDQPMGTRRTPFNEPILAATVATALAFWWPCWGRRRPGQYRVTMWSRSRCV